MESPSMMDLLIDEGAAPTGRAGSSFDRDLVLQRLI